MPTYPPWRHVLKSNMPSKIALLRERVVEWKSRFFARSWARYDLAVPGTFCLVPPVERFPELKRDYGEMRDMFLEAPGPIESVFETLSDLEKRINQGP